MTVAEIIDRLDARHNGKTWIARCPAHDDRTPSLSINEGRDGCILLNCHAGCETEKIVAALGLKLSDLFPTKPHKGRPRLKNGPVLNPGAAIAPIGAATNSKLSSFDWRACVEAVEDKDLERLAKKRAFTIEFCQWLKDNNYLGIIDRHFAFPVEDRNRIVGAHFRLRENWCYTPGAKTQLFVIGEVSNGNPIHIFESQWDAFAFLNALAPNDRKSVCVLITRGANNGALVSGVIGKNATAYLWPQNDEPGEKWTKVLCENLPIGCAIKVVRTPGKKDLNDWTRDGATAQDLGKAIADAEQLSILPLIQDAATLLDQPIILPPDVIEGIVHLGGKMVLGGASKTYKTWLLTDMAVSVATGAIWFNGYPTEKGRVLFVNFELPEPFFWHRIRTVCDERQLTIESDFLDVWNLRGHVLDWAKLEQQIQSGTYVLIILDPIYKLLLGRNENSAGDIASLLNELEVLAVRSGAAVAFGAHYSKGNQAQKESIDRIGGSGVFGRDPDTILNFTRHEEQDCFTVEMTLRNHPPREPFVVRWEYPLFAVDSLLDPNRLKQAGGRPRLATETQILDLLDEEPLKAVQWQKRAREEFGIASSTFYEIKKELEERDRIRSIAGVFSKT